MKRKIKTRKADGSCSCNFIGLMLEFHRRAYMDGYGYGEDGPGGAGVIQETILKIIRDSS